MGGWGGGYYIHEVLEHAEFLELKPTFSVIKKKPK